MRFLLVSQGTRGDVQPFVALAQALEDRGHDVVLGAPQWVSELLENRNIHHFILSDIEQELMADNAVRIGFETNYSGLLGKKLIFDVIRRYRIVSEKIFSELSGFLGFDVDAVVHHATLPAHEVAEAIGARAVPVCLEPSYVSTNQFPDPMLPFRIPRFLNSASYLLARRWAQVLFRNTGKWRAEVLKLPHRQGHKDPFRQPDGSPSLVLQAFSRELLPPAVKYPKWVHTTGFWFLSKSKPWQLPVELSDFLRLNATPIFIGFGSLASSDPKKREKVVAEAIDRANVSAVMVGGSGGLSMSSGNGNIFSLRDAPYDWLFPRMSAIVHHGGSGTSSLALAAGRPQVVCPAVYGQPFNAGQMHRIGVAAKPIPQRELTAKNLAEAIKRSISDETISACAKRISHRVRSESGVSKAVNVLESLTGK